MSPFAVGDFPQGAAITPDGAFLYVANTSAATLSGFAVQINGSLVEVPGSPLAGLTNPQDVDADSARVYVVEGTGANDVRVYDRGIDGSLTEVAGSPFATGGTASQHIDVAPSEAFLATANAGSDDVSVLSIGGGGALTSITGSPFADGNEPQGLVIRADSGRLFVADCVGDTISIFDLAGDGTPTEVTGSPFAGGDCPQEIAVAPSGDLIYVVSFDGVSGYSVAADGTLTGLANPLVFVPGFTAPDLAVSPDGTRLWVPWRDTVNDSAVLRVFAIQADGSLVEEGFSGEPITSEPSVVVADPDGVHVYVADLLAANVAGFALEPIVLAIPTASPRALVLLAALLLAAGAWRLRRRGGALTATAGSPFATGSGPQDLAIRSDTGRVFVADIGANTISVFELAGDGTPTAVAGSPFDTGTVPR